MRHLLDNTRRHDITFNAGGRIEISARVTKALDLKPGDVIDIAMSDRDREVYLYVKHRQPAGRHKAQVYVTNSRVRHCNSLRAHSVELCRKVLDMRGFSVAQVHLPVGEPEEIPCIGLALPLIVRFRT